MFSRMSPAKAFWNQVLLDMGKLAVEYGRGGRPLELVGVLEKHSLEPLPCGVQGLDFRGVGHRS